MIAPNFNLPDQNGKMHSLSDYKGKWVVVYFYPKDDTPGCTKEACSFRDSNELLKEKGIVVLGISKDTVNSHKKFGDKFQLNFPILSNPDKDIIRAFGALGMKKFMGKEYEGVMRYTYIINPKGEIVKKYEQVDVDQHAQDTLKDIIELQTS